MTKIDRRAKRTRNLLQKAFVVLLSKHEYDAITIQNIVDRANIGRTTFYLHYSSKDELFMSCHEAMFSELHFGPPFSREALLSIEAPPGMISAYQHLLDARALLHPVFQGTDGPLILRRIRDSSAHAIEESLRAAFTDSASAIPLDMLANYLAG